MDEACLERVWSVVGGTKCHVREGHIGGGKVLSVKKTGCVGEPVCVEARHNWAWIGCRSILISGEL